MASVTIDNPEILQDFVKDQETLAAKRKIMQTMSRNALFNSISSSCMFVAGPLFSIGASLLIPALTAAAGSAAAGLLPVGIGLMSIAAVVLGAAVVTGYAASMSYSSGQFDNFEMNAQSTARHLVQELQNGRPEVAEEHKQNVRADGKKWAQVVGRDNQQLQPT